MKKKKKSKKPDNKLKAFFKKHPITLGGIMLVAFFLYLIPWIYNDRMEIHRLKKDGVITPGYIYNERSGAKAQYFRFYRFTLSRGVFKGVSRGGDEGKHIGDSILVVYLPSDPTVSRSLGYMVKYRHYKTE